VTLVESFTNPATLEALGVVASSALNCTSSIKTTAEPAATLKAGVTADGATMLGFVAS
jgi:hypothetical protein